jgi:acetolactate synthase-1/2/3 large subunit
MWGEADVVLAVGTRLFYGFTQWGIDRELAIIRVDADPDEPERFARPAVALIGDAGPILRGLIDALAAHAARRAAPRCRNGKPRCAGA